MNLFKEGYKHLQGIEEAVMRNIQAVNELSEIVRTSFGPNGRNKMVINHLEKLFVTSDAATIIRELEVVHPAAKLLVMASQQQEAEMGDATNLVLIFAGELLKKAEYLITMGLHPSEILQGFELGRDKAIAELESECADMRVLLNAERDGHVYSAQNVSHWAVGDLTSMLARKGIGTNLCGNLIVATTLQWPRFLL